MSRFKSNIVLAHHIYKLVDEGWLVPEWLKRDDGFGSSDYQLLKKMILPIRFNHSILTTSKTPLNLQAYVTTKESDIIITIPEDAGEYSVDIHPLSD